LLVQFFQHRPAAGPVVFVGLSDVAGQQLATGINGELTLAPLDVFLAVKTLVWYAAIAALDRLCVQDG